MIYPLGKDLQPWVDFLSLPINDNDIIIVVRNSDLSKPFAVRWGDLRSALVVTGAISVSDEGTVVVNQAANINFTGQGVTVTASGNTATVNIPGGGGTPILLQTNSVTNPVQNILNLVEGTNMVITDDGLGNITFDATGGGGGWLLTGNNTLLATDYIGSNDPTVNHFRIKLNSIVGGYLDHNDYLVYLGYEAGLNNTGQNIVAFGNLAAKDNTGDYVVASGYRAAYQNTGSNDVIAIGNSAAELNSGNNLIALGQVAAYQNTGTTNIIAIGFGAGYQNSGLSNLVALGLFAGQLNQGIEVVAIGQQAANENTGDNVIAIGQDSLYQNTSDYAIGIGEGALQQVNPLTPSSLFPIGIGIGAGGNNTGNNVVFIGYVAGANNTFNNVIGLGANATPAANNEFTIDPAITQLNFALNGMTAGYVLTVDPTATYADWQPVSGGITLQTNGTINGDQTLLNLVQGTNMTITDDGFGNITFDATSSGGTVTSVATAGLISGGPITTSGTITTSMNTNKLVGRGSAGTGIMEEITLGTNLSLSGTTLNATSGGILHGTASGTDTYTVTITGVTAYNDGDPYLIRFTNGNTTTSTLNINGLGAIPLYRNNDGQVIGGDIWDGAEMLCVYNSTANEFQVIGTSPNSLFAYVTNAESISITKGQPVYAFGGTGDRMTVKLAFNTSDATSAQTVGLVYSTSIAANQKGFIIIQGLLDNLSILPTSTWSDGDPVYLGATAGAITKVKPYAPNHLVYLGIVTTASNGNAGRMYVRVQNGYELNEIHDVALVSPYATPVNNDVLTYITGTPNLWQARSVNSLIPSNIKASQITTILDGQGGVIQTGRGNNFLSIPFNGTITGWTILSSVSGSIEVAFWKDTYANYPPTVADNVFSPNPTLSAATKNVATGLSIAVTVGDIIIPNVVSVTTCTNVTIAIQITRS